MKGNKSKQVVTAFPQFLENRPKALLGEKNGKLILDPIRVRPFKRNPRTWSNKAKLEELKISIRAMGQIDPIKVKLLDGDPKYDFELVDGERRLRSCLEIVIPVIAILEEVENEFDQFVISFVSNQQREGHEDLDTARALEYMTDRERLTVAEAAQKVGRSPAWAYRYLSLLRLPASVLGFMDPSLPREQQLKMTVALEILKLPPEIQEITARNIQQRQMKTGQAKRYIEELAERIQVRIHDRGYSPRKEFAKMSRLTRKLNLEISAYSGKNQDKLYALFKDRCDPLADLDCMIQDIRDGQEQLKVLLDVLMPFRPDLEEVVATRLWAIKKS